MKQLIRYFSAIKLNKVVLWCYLIWYIATVYFYFDPSLKLWTDSIGISAVIGTGLLLNVSSGKADEGGQWQTFGLYLMPFCVSSFSALIKEQGFIVFVSPKIEETLTSVGICALFLTSVLVLKVNKNKIA